MRMIKNPRLNSYVYILTYVDGEPFCVSKDKVYMKSKETFITESIFNTSYIEEIRCEHYFDDYGICWFSKLKDARKYLKERYDNKFKLVKCYGDEWNIEEKE